jgi:REP element-mobilizing transposase RayT
MARYIRTHLRGVVHHLIARFVNKEFRMLGDAERDEYLDRLGKALARTDWILLAYALMSNHVHLCALSVEQPSERLIRPVHAGFARWLNARQGRLGPLFAHRHRAIACEDEIVGPLLAYLHNNPVRADVVADAADSTWTSHRAYLGLMAPPAWLDVATGLMLSGFDPTEAGRQAFAAFVAARSDAPRDPTLSGHAPDAVRRAARAHARTPLELASPRLEGGRLLYELRCRRHTPLRADGPVDAATLLATVAAQTGVATERLQSTTRRRDVVAARRIALLAWSDLGQPRTEMASALGLSDGAAAHLVRRHPERLAQVHVLARHVAQACRGAGTLTEK